MEATSYQPIIPAEKLSLILNANITSTVPEGAIEFILEIIPKISGVASLERLSLGVWASIGEVKVKDGIGKIVVKAPGEAGLYSYRASIKYEG